MSLFSSMSSLISVAIDSSSAAMAAKAKADSGGTVREILETFAAETDNNLDDRVVEELVEWAEISVEVLRGLASYAVQAARSSEEYIPTTTGVLRSVANRIEIQGPEIASFIRLVSVKASELADTLENQGGPVADSDNSTQE